MSDCVVCGQKVGVNGKTYELTEKERHTLHVLLQREPENPSYCRACDGLMHNAEQAAQFFKGLWMTRLRGAGVPPAIAEHHAQKMYDFYLKKAQTKAPS
jgi:hypothetical protein